MGNSTGFKAEEHETGLYWQVWADDMDLIADEISEEHARRIVTAVNNFDEMKKERDVMAGLLDALTSGDQWHITPEAHSTIRALLSSIKQG